MRLRVEKLRFGYRKLPVLQEVSFTAEAGDLLCVLGPNGVGKSTLLRCILGLCRQNEGRVLLEGRDVRNLNPRERAEHVAYIPQNGRMDLGYTVEDTVLMGTTRQLSLFARPGPAQRACAHEAMERVGINHLAGRLFTRLSGGEQQLALVARALAQRARILLMDEPTASLDYGNAHRVLSTAKSLAEEGYTVLITTHDPQSALRFGNRVLALKDGLVLALGRPGAVVTPRLLRALYGVDCRFVPGASGPLIDPTGHGPER